MKTTSAKNKKEIRIRTETAVLDGITRLDALLTSPDTTDGDVLKALSLLFEKIYNEPGQEGGDFDLRVRA